MEIKPPTKPGKNADEKALLAYHSELRRYHRRLEEWDERLRQRFVDITQKDTAKKIERLKEIINGSGRVVRSAPKKSDALPGPECGCSIEAACDGCDCPECEQWRKDYKITDNMVDEGDVKQLIAHARSVYAAKSANTKAAPVTDEVSKFFAQYEEQMANPKRDDEQRKNN